MTDMHLADCLKKLKNIAPESGDWITDRSETIADERLKQRSREIIAKTSITSPHMWRGMALGMSALFAAVNKQDHRQAQREAMQRHRDENGIGQSFEWAFENVRLAMVEYIIDNDIPLNTFDIDEQSYLFPNGIPATDLTAAL